MHGFNPKTNKNVWEDSYHAVGGDDFAESISLPLEHYIELLKVVILILILMKLL